MDTAQEHDRRVLDSLDFDAAAEFAKRLEAELTKSALDKDLEVVKALWLAAVVSYARPFTQRKDRNERTEPRDYANALKAALTAAAAGEIVEEEPKDYAKMLVELGKPKASDIDEEAVRVHEQAVEARHKELAHSDASVREIEPRDIGPPFGTVTTVRDPFLFPPPVKDVRRLRLLAEYLGQWVSARLRELEE